MLEIQIYGGARPYRPGEGIEGSASWFGEQAPNSLELRLFWYTEGRGDQDAGIAERLHIDAPGPVGSTHFEFVVPSGPYSYSGRLISICWALELVAQPGAETVRSELVVGPDGAEVLSRGFAA